MEFTVLKEILSRFAKTSVLVIGDIMIDEYILGNVDRVSPEAPVQVVDVQRETRTLGGAGNVIANVIRLGARVDLAGVIGDDQDAQWITEQMDTLGTRHRCLIRDAGRPTTKKTRIIAVNQQVVRIDRETRRPISTEQEGILTDFVTKNIERWQGIILSDYGKGMLTQSLLKRVISLGRRKGIWVVIDPKGRAFKRYKGAGIITPNKKEAYLGMGAENTQDMGIRELGEKMLAELDLKGLVITLGADGMYVFGPKQESRHILTRAREVYDVSGAGDTVASTIALCMASGASLAQAAEVANLAAGVVVGKVGTATVTQEEILSRSDSRYAITSKILKDRSELARVLSVHQQMGRKVVFTNGCFDLLHLGHIKLLHEAKSFGDILVVGLNTDASVRRLKGPSRPCLEEEERAHILAALDCVDYVSPFDEDTPLGLIRQIRPDILVKGSDYKKEEVVGWDVVEGYGGHVRLVELDKNFSTSRLIQKIINRHRS